MPSINYKMKVLAKLLRQKGYDKRFVTGSWGGASIEESFKYYESIIKMNPDKRFFPTTLRTTLNYDINDSYIRPLESKYETIECLFVVNETETKLSISEMRVSLENYGSPIRRTIIPINNSSDIPNAADCMKLVARAKFKMDFAARTAEYDSAIEYLSEKVNLSYGHHYFSIAGDLSKLPFEFCIRKYLNEEHQKWQTPTLPIRVETRLEESKAEQNYSKLTFTIDHKPREGFNIITSEISCHGPDGLEIGKLTKKIENPTQVPTLAEAKKIAKLNFGTIISSKKKKLRL